MKEQVYALGLMAALWAAGGRADEAGDMAPLRLTFVESLDIAFENSQWRSVSRLEVEIAAAQHRQALSTYWPQVVGRSVLTRRDDDPIFIFPDRHQASIDVESEVGKGTCFALSFPALQQQS